jgi:mRNA-degrading endonuclease RelE of RelBE toxin-antitoxin system
MKVCFIGTSDIQYGIMTMTFDDLPEFTRECKKLAKKYRSLHDDLGQFKVIVTTIPRGNSKHFNILVDDECFCVVKARLFCRYLKGSSLRIIYAYHQAHHRIEFIELYFKGDKESENVDRIAMYVKGARKKSRL